MKHIFYLFTVFAFISCDNKKEANTIHQTTYFGGEIINPNNNYVLLLKDNKLVDSIFLSANNTFTYQFKNFTPGLYTFNHKEFQYLHLEVNDSLFLRVNTIDFDETLTFSGKGAVKNNFLINSFLKNEADIKKCAELFSTSPENFIATTNRKLSERLANLERYRSKQKFSEAFYLISKTLISYPIYALREKYATHNYKNENITLPKEYFNYRKKINFNSHTLNNFPPYFNYMTTLVDQLTSKNSTDNTVLKIYKKKLRISDSITTDSVLRNKLLYKTAINFLDKKQNNINLDALLIAYKKYNTNNIANKYLTQVIQQLKQLKTGTKLPNFTVINSKEEEIDIHTVINKPTVFYFWTKNYPRHLKLTHEKAKLYNATTNYQFIGICVDNDISIWKKIISKLNSENEYLAVNINSISKKLLLNSIHKTFVTNKNSIILTTNLNLFDTQFKEKLQKLKDNTNLMDASQ